MNRPMKTVRPVIMMDKPNPDPWWSCSCNPVLKVDARSSLKQPEVTVYHLGCGLNEITLDFKEWLKEKPRPLEMHAPADPMPWRDSRGKKKEGNEVRRDDAVSSRSTPRKQRKA